MGTGPAPRYNSGVTYDPDPDAIDPVPNPPSFPLNEEGSALTRRTRLRAAGLASGRIPGWTKMGAAQLWREWRARFADNDDLALSALLDVGDRLARDQSPKQQEELRQLKRALLGDAFSTDEHLDAMGPAERARLPLPFAGVIRALKYVGVQRAGCRLWER